MRIIKTAVAGTLESNDALVEISPANGETTLDITSTVYAQFGADIERSVLSVLDELGVSCCCIRINDHGALECVIRARTETAVRRACEV
ncbi:MAG: citrate lyase acyl carrier protein [Clostridia bacterium]